MDELSIDEIDLLWYKGQIYNSLFYIYHCEKKINEYLNTTQTYGMKPIWMLNDVDMAKKLYQHLIAIEYGVYI